MTLSSLHLGLDDSANQERKQMLGADALMDSLRRHGVNTVFGYPGGAILPIYDAVYKAERQGWLKHIPVSYTHLRAHET